MQGLLLLNKPCGKSSFGAVAAIKRLAGEKRVGHTGTLDPMATGVLPVLLGRATALSGLMLDSDKRYRAEIQLGVVTDTEDITGSIIDKRPVSVSDADIEAAMRHFTGRIKQRPPMYSAIKKDGVRLYSLAREGKTVDIPEREITVFSAEAVSQIDSQNRFLADFYVSKGAYIRSLARDIGEYLGCGASLSALERTYAAGFSLEQCVELETLNSENIGYHILKEEDAVKHLREIDVTEKQAVRFCNGGRLGFERLRLSEPEDGELFRVKLGDLFLGVGYADFAAESLGIRCIINYPKEC